MVIFKDDQNEVDDVQCENFNYYEVAGRGIETSFDVIVTYREKPEKEIRLSKFLAKPKK